MKWMGWSYGDLTSCPTDTLAKVVEQLEDASRR